MTSDNNKEVDFLEVDQPLPGQNFCCLSFLSPEKVLAQKERFFMKSFLLQLKDITMKDIEVKYDDFIAIQEEKLNQDFHKESGFQTSVRGLKVRGVYNTVEEANLRAKSLQRLDRSFHVFVAQVGYWLPWDPNADFVGNQEYMEKELNELMKNYKSNSVERDIYYADQVEEYKREAATQNAKANLEKKTVDLEEPIESPSSILESLASNVLPQSH
jgi:hypothetical protein